MNIMRRTNSTAPIGMRVSLLSTGSGTQDVGVRTKCMQKLDGSESSICKSKTLAAKLSLILLNGVKGKKKGDLKEEREANTKTRIARRGIRIKSLFNEST